MRLGKKVEYRKVGPRKWYKDKQMLCVMKKIYVEPISLSHVSLMRWNIVPFLQLCFPSLYKWSMKWILTQSSEHIMEKTFIQLVIFSSTWKKLCNSVAIQVDQALVLIKQISTKMDSAINKMFLQCNILG
jgi:hypothetical protein